MKPPRHGDGGRVDDGLVQLSDVPATLADVAGRRQGDASSPFEGLSLLADERHEHVFAEYLVPNLRVIRRRFPDVDTSRLDRPLRMVSDGRYKLVVERGGAARLFDLDADPTESTDVSGDQPRAVERMTGLLV